MGRLQRVISFFCGSHKSRKSSLRQNGESHVDDSSARRLLSKINSNISSKGHSMMKMISWRKSQVGGGEEDYDDDDDGNDEAVWRKTIIMGARCRPLNFSGRILDDSEGNLLPDLVYHDQRPKIFSSRSVECGLKWGGRN